MTLLKPFQAPEPIVITTGEPAGIGMDIVLQVLNDKAFLQKNGQNFHILVDVDALYVRANMLGITIDLPANVQLCHIACAHKVIAGVLDIANAPMVLEQLVQAHEMAMAGAHIVTAPIQKSILMDANICLPDGTPFIGHTEFFMQKSGAQDVVMMLACDNLKVALATTHIALAQVPSALSVGGIVRTVGVIHQSLNKMLKRPPKILVCGLNPHAGESGHLGIEEITIINPALAQCRSQGLQVSDAVPADTAFGMQGYDVILAMYHDQGLAPFKALSFGRGVNVTLGLPYMRASVDHGTALDLAGTGRTSCESMRMAIDFVKKYTN